MKVGCCIFSKHIAFAKTFGYDYVELPAKEIMSMDEQTWKKRKEEILQADLPVIGLSAFADKSTPIIGPLANEKTWTTYLEVLLERASQLHIKNIGIGAPLARSIPAGYNYAQATKEMEYFLNKASTLADFYGMTILYEALHPKECNFGNHTLEIYNTVKKLNRPNLKIVYDIYHAINANETYEDARPLFDEIRHIHINSWDKDLNRHFLFEKDVPYMRELCRFLKSLHYDGTISVEVFDVDFEHTGAASVGIIKDAIAFAIDNK